MHKAQAAANVVNDILDQSHILQTLNYNFSEHIIAIKEQRQMIQDLHRQVCIM